MMFLKFVFSKKNNAYVWYQARGLDYGIELFEWYKYIGKLQYVIKFIIKLL